MKNRPFPKRLVAAWNGVRVAFRSEQSFRTQCAFALAALGLLVWTRPEPIWWAAFGLSIGGVLSCELINTALELVVDHLHPEQDPAIGLAKDCAAGAVLAMSGISVLVFLCFAYSKFGSRV